MTAHQLSSLESRLKSLSLPEDIAKKLGLSRGKNDSINIAYFGIKGDPVYISKDNRKTTTDLDDKRIYSRIRFSDVQAKIQDSKYESPYLVDQIAAAAAGITEAKVKGNKYASPYGTDPIWYLNALQLDYTGDTLILVEGEFKAIAITYHLGIPAVSFPGITVNNIDQAIEDLIVKGCPKTGQSWKNIICLYDKDALDISYSKKPETKGLPCTERAVSFCNSAFRFARQFYAIKQKYRLDTALHFAQISPTSEQKGIDDHISANGTKNALQAFKTLKTNEDIIVIPLYKSSYIKSLKTHFSLTDQTAFYNAHKVAIGEGSRFVFLGIVFEFTGTYFKVINDPHSFTGIAGTKIDINKYLSEKQQDIFDAIDKHYLSSLAAPTGSGKTTILKDLPGKKILCFPYRILAQQQAEKTGHRAFVGGVHPTDVPGIVSQDLIYCTYDKVQELSQVLPDSTLIIDEAHTLTKHYNFRKDTVRHLVEVIEKRKALKVILLSGTPDDLLCAMYNAHQIKVSRAVNNTAKVHPIIAANSGDIAMLNAALTVVRKFDKNKVNFVFQNDRAKLELLKKHLVEVEGWNSDDIVIITKDHVQNEDKTYLEIIEKEKITGAKLILTTQLIAEGININNTNIGDIVIIDLFCPKTFIQFVNRCRQVSLVNVYDIKAPEKILQSDFFQSAKDRANAKYIRANADALEIAAQHKKELENLTAEDQDFLCTINKNRGKQSKVRPYLYTCEGQIIVDRLQIVHEVDREIINESNNAYFYTQISNYQGIEICNAASDSLDDKDKESIKLTGQELENEKAQQQQALIKDLKTRPEVVITAYFNHCDKSSNRKGIEFINKHCPDLYKPSNEAYSYHANNSHVFTSPVLTELIQYFGRLHWIKLPKQDVFDCLDTYNRYAARTSWTAFVHQYTAQEVYPKRHYRQFMDQVQRNDIADLEKIKEKLGQGSVSMNLAKQVIKQVTGSYPMTDTKAFDLLKIIYEVSAHQKPAELERYDRYRDKDGKWIKVRDIENVPHSAKLKIGYTVKREKILYLKPYNRIYPTAEIWNDIKTFAAAILH